MPQLSGPAKAEYVHELFSGIARRYDLMNRLITAGQDTRWRREAIGLASLKAGARLLDLGAGTGVLAHEALRQEPQAHVTAADFVLPMMQAGKGPEPVAWCAADALVLPFRERTFDAVASGFVMRNVADIGSVLREQLRVLKPGGRVVILDTTKPRRTMASALIRLHMRLLVPALGGLLAGTRSAYGYLAESTDGFLSAEELASRMTEAGFTYVKFKLLLLGAAALHWARRAE